MSPVKVSVNVTYELEESFEFGLVSELFEAPTNVAKTNYSLLPFGACADPLE